jgi:AAA family ATP:ADP antiporter
MQGLLWLAAAMMGAIVVVIMRTETLISGSGVFRQAAGPRVVESTKPEESSQSRAAIEGARLVMRSKYLAAIVGIMACYEIASQTMDYQFSFLGESVAGVTETQAFIADIRFYANVLSVVVQLFLVSFIMRKFGLVVALLVLPLAIVGSSTAFLVVATLPVASLLHISDNGLNYSLQQTARESLYVVTTPDEKYKARAFTNMFVQRLAKGLSIFTVMGLVALQVRVEYLSLVTISVAVGMIVCSVYAGRQFARKSAAAEEVRAAG